MSIAKKGSTCMSMLLMLHSQSIAVSGVGFVNVYDKPMTQCGPDHASGCTYSPYDAGAHEVCVTQLPHGFSSDTGQGSWSDQFEGQPWCICIWAYSNYILQNKDLNLKCESIPSTVLEEKYSMDKFQQCGSMSSSAGCGAEDIRRSIQKLCSQCDQETTDPSSKAALKAKCDKILASGPLAAMQRLDDQSALGKAAAHLRQGTFTSPLAFGACALAAVGLLACGATSLRAFHRDHADPEDIDEEVE